ncbi:hypothetical protein B0H21DRAFT_722081 [Amylocystis lapponica]|nr:hypothetical protein B0H21DRAFT_722081 [Amylocystis lapponica]
MESSTTRKELDSKKQQDILRQIAALQAQLPNPPAVLLTLPASSPKRKQPPPGLLAPASPSPKRRKITHAASHDTTHRQPSHRPSSALPRGASSYQRAHAAPTRPGSTHERVAQTPIPATSTVLQKLASAHSQKNSRASSRAVVRSSGFSERPAPLTAEGDEADTPEGAQARDDRLALIEELVPGPVEHTAPFDDPHFEKLEPNSGIRLLSRSMPYEDFQDYLRGRYYLSPSKLYSVVRLLPHKQGYDVPVVGDWLTIAVVAERGKVKYTQAPVGLGHDDKIADDADAEGAADTLDGLLDGAPPKQPYQRPGKGKQQKDAAKPSGKKYVNMKLVDFGCRARAGGAQTAIRGDALLSLLLFEADGFDVVARADGRKEKVFLGGSRGAFERMSLLREGAVVAFLNPRILKPFQRAADAPHPTDNVLAITPESVSSLAVLGYAQDLGMCSVTRRDGTVCGSWCDKRVADVCEWHIQHAVSRKRAGRAEFATGTSGMTTGAAKKRGAYDPARKWGLKPEPDAGGATYIVSGHTISGGADTGAMFVGETLGRDAQAKASRKLSSKDADRALQRMLRRDKSGARAVMSAREFGKRQKEEANGAVGKDKDKGKGKQKDKEAQFGEDGSDSDESDDVSNKQASSYPVQLIRQLGFDPSAKDGRRSADAEVQSKLDLLTAVHAKRSIKLGPRPGKSSSCVRRPERTKDTVAHTRDSASLEDSLLQLPDSDDDDDLERVERAVFGKAVALTTQHTMVNLDSSDSELVVEPDA